jgi:hypothetical protein
MTVLKSILQSFCNAASYNKHELAAPRVLLWPDEEKLWSPCIAPLRASYPALWSLGDYCPEQATGHVLHVFQKKAKNGIATPDHELDLIRERLK